MSSPSTPKIRGFIAKEAPVMVFIYRQSSKISFLAKLDYGALPVKMQIGSRFFGKFYPSHCDLSPDGKFFLYFAMGKSQKNYEKKLYCWTAICQPPLVKAEILFGHKDTWGGGGLFLDEKTIFIDPGSYPEFDVNKNYQFKNYNITFTNSNKNEPNKEWHVGAYQTYISYGYERKIPTFWTKSLNGIGITKYYDPKKGYYSMNDYEVLEEQSGKKISLNHKEEVCTWADFDLYGRIVLARGSKVLIYQSLDDLIRMHAIEEFDLKKLIADKFQE